MNDLPYRVLRVFSNNAVLASHGEDELVLVGRGIGFGQVAGNPIPADQVQRQYLAVESDKAHYRDLVNSIDAELLETISTAVDLASDLLGELHPSVYLVLTDHLAFAVQRLREGEIIRNPLLEEIRVVFPAEFGAAELVLQYINSRLGIDLPADETAFITLHLNAARHGSTVKRPLQQANAVAGIIEMVHQRLGQTETSGRAHDELVLTVVHLGKRLQRSEFRRNQAARSIQRDLPRETEVAAEVIRRILQTDRLPAEAAGEVAHLAVFLNGWLNDPIRSDSKPSTK